MCLLAVSIALFAKAMTWLILMTIIQNVANVDLVL